MRTAASTGGPADRRAAGRLLLALTGALVIAGAAVPLALAVRGAWPPLLDADLVVSAAAERAVAGSPALLLAARTTTLLGDPVLLWLLTVAVAVVLHRRGASRLAVFVLAVRLGAQVLSSGLKAVVDRARPVFDVPVDTALGASFPSGHALGSAAVWTGLALVLLSVVRRRRWLLLAGALVLMLLVSASRVLLGLHYLSDVVAGMLIGAGWTAVCAALWTVWRAEQGRPVDAPNEGLEPELRR